MFSCRVLSWGRPMLAEFSMERVTVSSAAINRQQPAVFMCFSNVNSSLNAVLSTRRLYFRRETEVGTGVCVCVCVYS